MTDEDLAKWATTFTLIRYTPNRPFGHVAELKVEWRGENAWAIVDSHFALNRDGEWEHEPFPSNRSDQFIARTRWPSAREAIVFAQEHMRQHPTGYKDEESVVEVDDS
jgi:hypothetical protein